MKYTQKKTENQWEESHDVDHPWFKSESWTWKFDIVQMLPNAYPITDLVVVVNKSGEVWSIQDVEVMGIDHHLCLNKIQLAQLLCDVFSKVWAAGDCSDNEMVAVENYYDIARISSVRTEEEAKAMGAPF